MKRYTKEDLLKQLCTGQLNESETVEFKEQWRQSNGKSFSAIGNGEEIGWMLIGVDDNSCLINEDIQWAKKQKHQIESHITAYLNPSATVQSISVESFEEKHFIVIEIIIPTSTVSWNQKYYKRNGSITVEMSPGEKKQLELKRPGFDFSNLKYEGDMEPSLVLDFAKFLPKDNGDWTKLTSDEILSRLNIKNRNVSGILFGDFSFRLVHYKSDFEVLDQKETKGLYHLLQENFIHHIQSWARKKPIALKSGSLSVMEEKPYSDDALREVLVNAVAHSAFEKRGGGIKVELYPDRIEVSNHCLQDAEAFINKRFSKDSFSPNMFLMKILRMANLSEELGTGKNKIFKYVIEDGKREPLFEYRKASNNYGIWSVTLYNEKLNENLLNLLERLKTQYGDKVDKYKLSAALVLWRGKSLKEILSYMDEHHAKLTLDILTEEDSPFLVTSEELKSKEKILTIGLKRWGILKLKGQESKVFSEGEESKAKEMLRNYAYENERKGYITNKEARHLLGLSDSKSEQVQVSRLFQQWEKENFVEKGRKKGIWRIKKQFDDEYASLLEYLRNYRITK